MIVAVNGYNGKKNKATMTTACLAGMSVMTINAKTLVIQLLDADISSVEQMLNGRATIAEKNTRQITFSEEGIDALLRAVDSNKIIRDDFKQFCTPMMQTENLLDVTAISKNKRFTETFMTKIENLKNVLESAQDIYDNIFLLVSPREEGAVKAVNEMADHSIYCLTQGHLEKGNIYGKNISFVITDFEPESMFSLKSAKKSFCTRKERIFKINRNIGCIDASHNGTLLSYIKKNREVDVEDINFVWHDDLRRILDYVLYGEGTENRKITENMKKHKEEVRTYKECEGIVEKEEKFELAGYDTSMKEKQGFFSRLFNRNKKRPLSVPRTAIEERTSYAEKDVSDLPEELETELEHTLAEDVKNNMFLKEETERNVEMEESDDWEEIEEQNTSEEIEEPTQEIPITAEAIKMLIQETLKDMANTPETKKAAPKKAAPKKATPKRTTTSKATKASATPTVEKIDTKKTATKAVKEEVAEESQPPKKTTVKRTTKKADEVAEETVPIKKTSVKKTSAKKVKEVSTEVPEEANAKTATTKTTVKKETAAKPTTATKKETAAKTTTVTKTTKTGATKKTATAKTEVEIKEQPKKTATRAKKTTADKTE